MNFPISGPIPPYSNPPIEPQYFQPSRFVISAISLGPTTIITTSVAHNYVIGQQVRVLIPFTYGCQQLSGQSGFVIAIPSATQVTLDINSFAFDPFVPSPVYGPTPPQIVAIGDLNTGLISSTGRVVPTTTIQGSFINISPQ